MPTVNVADPPVIETGKEGVVDTHVGGTPSKPVTVTVGSAVSWTFLVTVAVILAAVAGPYTTFILAGDNPTLSAGGTPPIMLFAPHNAYIVAPPAGFIKLTEVPGGAGINCGW